MVKSLAFAALLISCKSKEEAPKPAATPPKATEPAPAPKADDGPAVFAQWDMPARKAAWKGAWAGDGNSLGNTAAWSIDDAGHITFVDKKGEQKLELEIESPCTATFTEKTASGSSGWTSVYTLKNGELITGLGDAGSKKGDKAIVCGGGEIFVFDGKACTDWANHFHRWESKPGECGFKKDDKGKDVFWYKTHGSESTLLVEGDVIWSEQLAHSHATKHPDLAAAKAAQKL